MSAIDQIREDIRNGLIPSPPVARAVGLSAATVREWADRPDYVATSYDARLSRWALQEQCRRDTERWRQIQEAAARHDDGQAGPWDEEGPRHRDLMWLVHAYARAREVFAATRHDWLPLPGEGEDGGRAGGAPE